jgi:hypothetical protein
MRWLVESERRQPARALLEAQVDLAERMGDLPVAIDALRRLIARDGVTTLRAMRLATFHGLRGEVARGYEAMRPLAEQGAAAETDAAFWRLYGNLAWSLQIESQALHALTLTTRQDGFSAIEADRLRTPRRASPSGPGSSSSCPATPSPRSTSGGASATCVSWSGCSATSPPRPTRPSPARPISGCCARSGARRAARGWRRWPT